MKRKRKSKKLLVRRITVDEKLSDDLIRIVDCHLKKGRRVFTDKEQDWGIEREHPVTEENYIKKIGIPEDQMHKYKWADMKEGMVFLVGNFDIEQTKRKPKRFVVDRRRQSFARIDDLAGELMEKLYFSVLKGGSHA